ncbi:hypothetical protein E2C01_081301 [Portunus trituberculatus]|uniref:Uncharacterized protein n=1 Tax=Portunus trituberculatus TaxID=210409 RepID=A0A5B7ILV5_PORTR|nr:hypothetical protein [Portunus trituberculatus]
MARRAGGVVHDTGQTNETPSLRRLLGNKCTLPSMHVRREGIQYSCHALVGSNGWEGEKGSGRYTGPESDQSWWRSSSPSALQQVRRRETSDAIHAVRLIPERSATRAKAFLWHWAPHVSADHLTPSALWYRLSLFSGVNYLWRRDGVDVLVLPWVFSTVRQNNLSTVKALARFKKTKGCHLP